MSELGRALRASAAVALVGLLVALLVFEGRPLLVVLAGALVAVALRGVSRWTARKARLPYWLVLTVLVIACVAAAVLGAYFLGAGIAQQADAFAQQVPAALRSLTDALRRTPALTRLAEMMDGRVPARLPPASSLAAGAGGALEALSGLVLVFFIGLYGAAAPGAYPRVVLALVAPEHRARAETLLDDLGASLTRWLGGRAVAMVSVGVMVTIGLYALGIPLAGVLGVLAGWLTFVEYLGAVASALPAMLLALSRGPQFVLGVGVLFVAAHVLEGYLLTPLLTRSTVRIPPAYALAAQIVMGSVFGVLGLTFATPVILIGTVLAKHLVLRPRRERTTATRA